MAIAAYVILNLVTAVICALDRFLGLFLLHRSFLFVAFWAGGLGFGKLLQFFFFFFFFF